MACKLKGRPRLRMSVESRAACTEWRAWGLHFAPTETPAKALISLVSRRNLIPNTIRNQAAGHLRPMHRFRVDAPRLLIVSVRTVTIRFLRKRIFCKSFSCRRGLTLFSVQKRRIESLTLRRYHLRKNMARPMGLQRNAPTAFLKYESLSVSS